MGPVIGREGLAAIEAHLGRRPAQATWEEAARARARHWTAFRDVPHARWLHEVRNHYEETPAGLALRYDPALRDAFLGEGGAVPEPGPLWPLFDALAGLPLCVIRGEGSDLLSRDTLAAMRARRPDAVVAEVPGRGHVPFLDEPGSLAALAAWLDLCRARAAG